MPKSVADVLALKSQVQMVDFRFTDLPGVWQHFTVPVKELTEETFEDGIGFDGSSIRGFKEIHESDMLLMLDPDTAFVDPIYEVPTLAIICDVYDPITREPYTRDPRFIAQRAEAYLKQTGIGETSYWGPEAEFFMFSDVRYGVGRQRQPITTSTARRAGGTAARTWGRTSAARLPPSAATSRCRPPTRSRMCAAGSCWRSKRSASTSKSTITRSPPPARPRSTCASTR